jgi:hypothetical protein
MAGRLDFTAENGETFFQKALSDECDMSHLRQFEEMKSGGKY